MKKIRRGRKVWQTGCCYLNPIEAESFFVLVTLSLSKRFAIEILLQAQDDNEEWQCR
ncbi:hypothetical protein [Pedobacter sp. SL55]|uniref:hypothetical protein n=1 Tax=Pedobacter sp. SL55 TaxID=2995161 RepID=UPI00226DEF5C|nr:hypothetical protein [Pedobacter sp. SL55]WAC41169.1 hypothetical protein OVA16_01990 [Pedobacter sp. SL55]